LSLTEYEPTNSLLGSWDYKSSNLKIAGEAGRGRRLFISSFVSAAHGVCLEQEEYRSSGKGEREKVTLLISCTKPSEWNSGAIQTKSAFAD
jgi:hypothetical protein